MNSKPWRAFTLILAIVLVAAILPSLTALSASYFATLPGIAAKTGPLNPLKFFAPFLFVFVAVSVFRVRRKEERRAYAILGVAWGVGALCTFIAARRCGFPSMFLREWATLSLGLLVGTALRFFRPKLRDAVYLGWFAIVFIAIALDLFSPSAIDWLYARVFDPETRIWDIPETGAHALTGVFGRQSAAKLMAWLPWLVTPMVGKRFPKHLWVWVLGVGVWSGLILATSQRGPMIASFAALIAFGLHRAWREKKPGALRVSIVAAVIGGAAIFLVVPSSIVGPRLLHRVPVATTGAPVPNGDRILRTSETNARFRWGMTQASLDSIRGHPLGDACIPKEFFAAHGVNEGHSHSLFLEQYRSRGWLWGTIHLLLWLGAVMGFIRSRGLKASAGAGALVAIFVCGLVDHPWFVLNQSIVLGAVLVDGVIAYLAGDAVTADEIQ
jgi:hypothetical protein